MEDWKWLVGCYLFVIILTFALVGLIKLLS